jgi:hypothetical protein
MIDRDGMWDFLLYSIDMLSLFLLCTFVFLLLPTSFVPKLTLKLFLFLFFSFILHSESLQWSDVDHSLFSISLPCVAAVM